MKRPRIKIGIAGTHSTGKSTLLGELRTRLEATGKKVGTVGDLATEARDLGFPILRDHTFQSTAWIMARGMTLELQASKDSDVILVDRPVPDALGYLLAALEWREESLGASEMKYLRELVRLHARTYDLLLMTRIDPTLPINTSKERDHDARFRVMAENGIKRAFRLADLTPVIVERTSTAAVIERVVKLVLRGEVKRDGKAAHSRN